MNRPNIPALDELESILQDIEEMERIINKLKQRIREIPSEIRNRVGTKEELFEVARYLYWMMPDVPVQPIVDMMGMKHINQMKVQIGATQTHILCERCNEPIPVYSRTQMKGILGKWKLPSRRYAEGFNVLCKTCEETVFAERRVEVSRHQADIEERNRTRLERLYALQTMPYHEYLQTPEWQERRLHHLKSVGYRCQVCNAGGVELHVHHRTYERRGQELYKDLIVLCYDCHEIFHREGKLVD